MYFTVVSYSMSVTLMQYLYCVNNSRSRIHVGDRRGCEEDQERDVHQRNCSILHEQVGQGGEGERWLPGQQEGNDVWFYLSMGLANVITSVDPGTRKKFIQWFYKSQVQNPL